MTRIKDKSKLKNKKHGCLDRDGIFTLEQILPLLGTGTGARFKYNGHSVKTDGSRLRTLKKSQTCISCGLIGTFFAIEKPMKCDDSYWHFNLYGIDEFGDEVLMTQDHILPLSKGGHSVPENLQTMCKPCNEAKGDKTE